MGATLLISQGEDSFTKPGCHLNRLRLGDTSVVAIRKTSPGELTHAALRPPIDQAFVFDRQHNDCDHGGWSLSLRQEKEAIRQR